MIHTCIRGAVGLVVCATVLTLSCSDNSGDDAPGASGTGGSSAGQGGSGVAAGSGGSSVNGGSGGSGAAGAAGAAGAGGAAIDTTGKEKVWTDAIASEALSCDEVCAKTGNECAPVCGDDEDTAVDALYRFAQGGFALQQQPAFDFCDEPPSPTMTFNMTADEYTLVGFRCCCLAPAVTRVMGDPTNRIPCDEVCQAEGLTCREETDWGVGTSGMLQTFSAVPTEMRLILGDCDEVPLSSVNRSGVDEPLVAYQCGCVP